MARIEHDLSRILAVGALFLTSCTAKAEAKDKGENLNEKTIATLTVQTPIPTLIPNQLPESIPTPNPAMENKIFTPEVILPSLPEFVSAVKNGKNLITGVYSPWNFGYGVAQQPEGNPGFVLNSDSEFTQFDLKSIDKNINTTAFLAHDFTFPGEAISNMHEGQSVILVKGTGEISDFTIDEIISVQALSPYSMYSDFVDLKDGKKYSAGEIFNKIYGGTGEKIVFQTCIAKDGNDSWGRIFIIGR